MILVLTTLTVLVIDQALKVLVRSGALAPVALGPFGSLELVEGRLWMHRVGRRSPKALWLWILPATLLIIASAWIPSSGVFMGLLLGGSLSNATDNSLRGSVTDYVCLRFWPAFNVADVALTVGAIGVVVELVRTASGTAA